MSDDDRLADELASLRIERGGRKSSSTVEPARRRGGWGWVIALIVLAAGGVGSFFLFREGKGRIFASEVELGSVSLMSPAQQDVTLVATGYVYARKKATVAPKAVGRIAKLLVDETSTVKENQVIAELESSDAQAAMAQLRADIAAARARAERARADVADADIRFQREDALLKRGAGIQANFDDAKSRLTASRSQVSAVEAEMRAIEARQSVVSVQLENTRVRAPFAGTVIRKLAEVGEMVSPSTAAGIVTIATLDDLEVQADVSESQFSKVKVGTPTEILLDAFPDKRFRGAVSEIRQSVDRAKAAVTVKVRFSDDSKGVLPDMAAKVSFLTHALDEQALKAAPKLVAPADAIARRDGEPVLFTVEDGHARQQAVKLGPQIGTQIELVSGPSAGTQVIRNPTSEIRDGFPIKEKKK
ncbi:MAG TPA: efflux RND transporter periplasmic adaptor subunit [Polyangia bacterium]|nr:efflux RND transporter periplasmic adaptor subunit [Polyangia bacterium]